MGYERPVFQLAALPQKNGLELSVLYSAGLRLSLPTTDSLRANYRCVPPHPALTDLLKW